jgi:hypothetical protein
MFGPCQKLTIKELINGTTVTIAIRVPPAAPVATLPIFNYLKFQSSA